MSRPLTRIEVDLLRAEINNINHQLGTNFVGVFCVGAPETFVVSLHEAQNSIHQNFTRAATCYDYLCGMKDGFFLCNRMVCNGKDL